MTTEPRITYRDPTEEAALLGLRAVSAVPELEAYRRAAAKAEQWKQSLTYTAQRLAEAITLGLEPDW